DFFFFSSRRRHTRCYRDWSSDVCSSDLDSRVRGSNRACRATGGRRGRDGDARRQDGMIHELENLQGAPGTKRAGARRRIVDELGALQMDATCAEIADFESGFAAQALLDRRAPLLDILCGSMGMEGRKADRGRAENGGS